MSNLNTAIDARVTLGYLRGLCAAYRDITSSLSAVQQDCMNRKGATSS